MTKKKEAFNVGVDADVGTEWEETPKRNWPDGTQNEMEMTKVDQFSGDICGNCCTCHLR